MRKVSISSVVTGFEEYRKAARQAVEIIDMCINRFKRIFSQ